MMMDRARMLSIGSPFGQSYVDRHDHPIDAWIRGNSEGFPKHDAGFTMTGPARDGFLETMRLFWNNAAGPNDTRCEDPISALLPPTVMVSPCRRARDACARFRSCARSARDQFDGMPRRREGNPGGVSSGDRVAKDFIYLETQYFTNDAIGDALVKAMMHAPQLQMIVLLNIEPDVPRIRSSSAGSSTRIRKAIGQTPTGPRRFGVFTRWTHEVGPRLRPRMLPIYIHAKVGDCRRHVGDDRLGQSRWPFARLVAA